MPDPTPDAVQEALAWLKSPELADSINTQRRYMLTLGAVTTVGNALAAQRALLAEWLADHYERCHNYKANGRTPKAECARWAVTDTECQFAERTRRLGVEGAG